MKVFVSGHKGMVGSAIIRGLKKDSVSWDILVCDRKEVDLCDQSAVEAFLDSEKPDMVLNAAGRVGGICQQYLPSRVHQGKPSDQYKLDSRCLAGWSEAIS